VSAVPALSGGCTTVSAAGPVMTASETAQTTPPAPVARALLARLARLAPLPDGLGFEVCELCGAFLSGRDSLALHMARAHRLVLPTVCLHAEKPIVHCDKCTERFWSPAGLAVHVDRMHGQRTEPASPPITVCPLCKRTRLTDVLEHLARQHRITLVDMFAQRYCSICQLSLHAARSFEHHMMTRHGDLLQDRAGLYAAIVMVDRAARGRVGMVARGRQPAVLAGATGKPVSDPTQPGSLCPVCRCEFPDVDKVEEHVRRVHAYVCTHCDRKCTSVRFLSHHVMSAHSSDSMACELCGSEVSVLAMAEHLQASHVRPCAVTLTRVAGSSALSEVETRERKRRRGSESSDSLASSDDDSVVIVCEQQPPAKMMKTL